MYNVYYDGYDEIYHIYLGDLNTFGSPLDFVRIFIFFIFIIFIFIILISSQFCSLSTSITTWPYDLKLLPMIATGLT